MKLSVLEEILAPYKDRDPEILVMGIENFGICYFHSDNHILFDEHDYIDCEYGDDDEDDDEFDDDDEDDDDREDADILY